MNNKQLGWIAAAIGLGLAAVTFIGFGGRNIALKRYNQELHDSLAASHHRSDSLQVLADALSAEILAHYAKADSLAQAARTDVVLPAKLKLRQYAPADSLRAVWDKPME